MSKRWFAIAVVVVFLGASFVGLRHGFRETVAIDKAAPLRFGPVQETANGAFRMKTESHQSSDFLTFHVSERMTKDIYEDLQVTTDSPNMRLLRDLSELPGVKHVVIRPYEIVVEKGEVFQWPEIMAPIATTIRIHLEPRAIARK